MKLMPFTRIDQNPFHSSGNSIDFFENLGAWPSVRLRPIVACLACRQVARQSLFRRTCTKTDGLYVSYAYLVWSFSATTLIYRFCRWIRPECPDAVHVYLTGDFNRFHRLSFASYSV